MENRIYELAKQRKPITALDLVKHSLDNFSVEDFNRIGYTGLINNMIEHYNVIKSENEPDMTFKEMQTVIDEYFPSGCPNIELLTTTCMNDKTGTK